jgi:hypothetical protein
MQRRQSWGRQGVAVLGEAHQASGTGQHSRWALSCSLMPSCMHPCCVLCYDETHVVASTESRRSRVACLTTWHCCCTGRGVSDKCQAEVAAYKIERSKHINRDVALGRSSGQGQLAALASSMHKQLTTVPPWQSSLCPTQCLHARQLDCADHVAGTQFAHATCLSAGSSSRMHFP